MIKQIKKVVFLIAVSVSLLFLYSCVATTHTGKFEYSINSDGKSYYLSNYDGGDRFITIPNRYKGYPVTSIGPGAFAVNTILENVLIPNTITVIEFEAFKNNTSLNKVSFEENSKLVSIGDFAFSGASNLNSIDIPSNVNNLGTFVFSGARNLTSIVIPDGVNKIGNSAFSGATSLTSIKIPDSVTIIGDSAFKGTISLENIIIPNSVKEIGDSVFENASNIKSLNLPINITSIGKFVFKGATNLINIAIPEGVTSIGTSAFEGASSLKSIDLPNSLTSIGDFAFYGASSLESILIPEGVTRIGASAFEGASSLKSIDLPNSLTSIEDFAFYGASNLKNIEIPNRVTRIGSSAFGGISNLESISVPFVGESVEARFSNARFGYIFGTTNYKDSYSADGYYLPITLNEVVITGGNNIVGYAFKGAKTIKNIVISDTIVSIGTNAFEGLSSLETITLPFIGADATNYGIYAQFGWIFGTYNYENSYNAEYLAKDSAIQKSYYIPKTLREVIITKASKIDWRSFSGVSSLKTIKIPKTVITIGYEAFINANNLTIYTEFTSKPNGWHTNWNPSNRPVVWGYTD